MHVHMYVYVCVCVCVCVCVFVCVCVCCINKRGDIFSIFYARRADCYNCIHIQVKRTDTGQECYSVRDDRSVAYIAYLYVHTHSMYAV